MLTKIEEQYLTILQDHLQQKETTPSDGLRERDWRRIAQIARIQVTQGILWAQCGTYLKERFPSIAEDVHQGFLNDVCRSVYYETDLSEVDRILTRAQIPYTVMKGIALYHCYPKPRLRTMSDIDIIIRPEDRKRSDEAMRAAGYHVTVPTLSEYVYERDIVEYEFHDTMMPEPLTNDIDYHSYFAQVWNHVTAPASAASTYHPMEESFHFLYLFVHIAKHVLDAGMGFRSYMDLPIYARAAGERIDWDWIRQELDRLELLRFAGICETFCERWFGLGFPIDSVEIDEEFYEYTTHKIMGEGIYGYEDEENTTGYSAKTVRRSNKPYWYTSIGIICRKVFPNYDNMRLIKWYSFVDGKPWLLPVAWVYRWGYVLRNKRKTGKSVLTETISKRKIIEKRQKYYEKWGL